MRHLKGARTTKHYGAIEIKEIPELLKALQDDVRLCDRTRRAFRLSMLAFQRPGEIRQEELHPWQRLVRMLGHELNNSLAPIISIAGGLQSLPARESPPGDWRDDMERVIAVIAARAAALNRFMEAVERGGDGGGDQCDRRRRPAAASGWC